MMKETGRGILGPHCCRFDWLFPIVRSPLRRGAGLWRRLPWGLNCTTAKAAWR